MTHEHFATARELISAGRFDAAVRLLSLEPAVCRQRDILLGAAYIGRRDRAKAFGHLHRALEQAPGDPAALFQLGKAHLLANDGYAAVMAFETVRAAAPDFPGLRAALASAYRRDARYADAIRLAETASACGAERIDLLYERAVSQTHLGNADGALATYDALLAIDPDHAAAWFGSHAPALQSAGIEDALRRLHRAVACRGANGRYWAYLHVYNLLLGRHEAAEAIHADKLARHPRRMQLSESVAAILPGLAPDAAVFGVGAYLLRHALARATVPGMVLEFGVRRGNSINQIAAVVDQAVHGFDSFEGLPEAWGNEPQGILTTGKELPTVRPNVVLHAGWFDQTLPAFLERHPDPVRFVNIDSDIYASAKTVLTALAGRIRPGTVLVFDEFIGNRSWREDEYKAFHEYVREHDVSYSYIAVGPFTKQVAVLITGVGTAVDR